MSQNINDLLEIFNTVLPRPLSLFEREEAAKELREKAAKLIAEAERIEAGCASDRAEFNKAIESACQTIKTGDAWLNC